MLTFWQVPDISNNLNRTLAMTSSVTFPIDFISSVSCSTERIFSSILPFLLTYFLNPSNDTRHSVLFTERFRSVDVSVEGWAFLQRSDTSSANSAGMRILAFLTPSKKLSRRPDLSCHNCLGTVPFSELAITTTCSLGSMLTSTSALLRQNL